jgi:hypothetical protein
MSVVGGPSATAALTQTEIQTGSLGGTGAGGDRHH